MTGFCHGLQKICHRCREQFYICKENVLSGSLQQNKYVSYRVIHQITKEQWFFCVCFIFLNIIWIFSLLSRIVNSKSVIEVACDWMEIENKQESRPLKDHHLVFIVHTYESSLFDETKQ